MELRHIRERYNLAIKSLVTFTDVPPFRTHLENLPDSDPVKHYWAHHNPFTRIINRAEPMRLQGFNAECLHVGAYDAEFPTGISATNAFLFPREDSFLYFVTILLEDLGFTELANQVREARRSIPLFEMETRTLLSHKALDPLGYYDQLGHRRPVRGDFDY